MFDQVGVQLYTLREAFAQDPVGLLAHLARLGVREVEGTADLPLSTSALRGVLDREGLAMPTQHVPLEQLENAFHHTVQTAKTLGVHTLIVPWVNPENHRTLEEARHLAHRLTVAGQKLHALGLKLGYHHHDFEFSALLDHQELTLWDVLLTDTRPQDLGLELDVFWLWYAGRSPTLELELHQQRLLAVHLKDGRAIADGPHFMELGLGEVPLGSILDTCKKLQVKHLFIEQDHYERPAVESIEISLQWMRARPGTGIAVF